MKPLDPKVKQRASDYISNIANQKRNTEYRRKYLNEVPGAREKHNEAQKRHRLRKLAHEKAEREALEAQAVAEKAAFDAAVEAAVKKRLGEDDAETA